LALNAVVEAARGRCRARLRGGGNRGARPGATLNKIVEPIRDVSTIVSDIAKTTNEQAEGIDHVNKALTSLDEMPQQNSALVEENAATAKTLEHKSADMAQRVAYFKLGVKAVATRAAERTAAAERKGSGLADAA